MLGGRHGGIVRVSRKPQPYSPAFVAVAALLFGIAALIHVLDPLLGHPAAHFYDSLSPWGQHIWNATVVAFGSLLIGAGLFSWLIKRFRRRETDDENV